MLKEDRAGDPYYAWLQGLTEGKCRFGQWASYPVRQVVYAKKSKSKGNPLPGGRRERIAARADKAGKQGGGGGAAAGDKRPADAPAGDAGDKRARAE